MNDYKNNLNKVRNDVKTIHQGVSDEVLIAIANDVKEILILLINKAFDRTFVASEDSTEDK